MKSTFLNEQTQKKKTHAFFSRACVEKKKRMRLAFCADATQTQRRRRQKKVRRSSYEWQS